MAFYVYMLKSINSPSKKTYVGYTKNISQRLILHNSSKGAKFTRGFKWVVIYRKKFEDKKSAMSYEYKLKKDYKKRLILYKKSL